MCGIAGIYNINKNGQRQYIKQMTDILKHRGPDDEGYLAINTQERKVYELVGSDSQTQGLDVESFDKPAQLFLGHRRLSILDLSSLGHQPMTNHDGSLWVVYNGEIYNYLELKEELRSLGCVFKTNTDTEVLLAAYQEWGQDCLSKFNGMWAFVIYDKRENCLFGSRDRFGVKPLYYYLDSQYFIFASEIKALVSLNFVERKINNSVLFDYLVLGSCEHQQESLFKNIFSLEPSFSFYYDLSKNTFKKQRYYVLRYTNKWERFEQKKSEDYINRTKRLVSDAVALRLRSDVPVGSCLSGGIDSSTIVSLVDEMLKKESIVQIGDRQNVFTANYDSEDIDEAKWAKKVVEKTRVSWWRVFPKAKNFLRDIEDLIYTQDLPFISTSIYAQYRVMKLVREKGIKVLLDGQGGDELFTGYAPYFGSFFAEMIKHFDFRSLIRESINFGNSPINVKDLLGFLIRIYGRKVLGKFLALSLKKLKQENGYINNNLWKNNKHRVEIVNENITASLNKTLHSYMTEITLKSLLRYEDRNSMRFSIEARTPFADDVNLIESIFSIPSVYKIHQGWTKFLLRQSMKAILPLDIVRRKDKLGFATPEYRWLKEIKSDLKRFISKDLDEFVDVKRLNADWDNIIDSQPRQGVTNLWRFINFAIWKKVYKI